MRCQPVLKCPEANKLRGGRLCGKWIFVPLVPLLLAGCLDEGADKRQAASEPDNFPSINERIDRSMKSDRLRASKAPARRSLDEARAAALHAVRGGVPLANFYRALAGLQSGLRQEPVTILHLGDSHIAADNFSGDLRALFQARFGDAGRGMMMPGFPFPYYRARGVSFERKGAWKAANSFNNDPGSYGLSGVRLSAREKGARLTLTSKEGAFEWAEVAFLTQPNGGEVDVSFGGARRTVTTSATNKNIKRVRIDRKGRTLEVVTKDKGVVSILSWAVGQNRPGLRYVNFGIPGATADTPRRWDKSFVQDGLAHLKPSLVVLGYGTNEGFNDDLDSSAYELRITALVARLKKHAPQASILILGPPDSARFPRFARAQDKDAASSAPCRALSGDEVQSYTQLKKARSKQLARWHAPPKLKIVRASLRSVADIHGAYFWDWSSVMNGPCGIHAWTQAEPPLAARDHVHMRSAGAKRSASALFNEVMAGYDAHVRLASR
jgi:lysophospholipase L1-like esterase